MHKISEVIKTHETMCGEKYIQSECCVSGLCPARKLNEQSIINVLISGHR